MMKHKKVVLGISIGALLTAGFFFLRTERRPLPPERFRSRSMKSSSQLTITASRSPITTSGPVAFTLTCLNNTEPSGIRVYTVGDGITVQVDGETTLGPTSVRVDTTVDVSSGASGHVAISAHCGDTGGATNFASHDPSTGPLVVRPAGVHLQTQQGIHGNVEHVVSMPLDK